MSSVPMKFKGVQWRHNPKEIKFECEKGLKELSAPFEKSYIQNTGRKNMRISGTGELFGYDCMQQFSKLFELFKQGGTGVLAIHGLPAIYAVFESLEIKAQPKPDILCYSFAFREVMEEKGIDAPSCHIMRYGETLWDIAYLYGVPIDELVRLNPKIRRPDESIEGFAVIIC